MTAGTPLPRPREPFHHRLRTDTLVATAVDLEPFTTAIQALDGLWLTLVSRPPAPGDGHTCH